MDITVDTKKSVAQLQEDVPKACALHGFGVLGTIDLRARLAERGVAYPRACVVFEVCNPMQAKRALDAEPRVSAALPCRIAAFETADGKVRLGTLRPTALIGMIGEPRLAALATEVEDTLERILQTAAS